jgi:hypothetical protein
MSFTIEVCTLLSDWITFLLGAVAPRCRLTFVELLCGCLMSQEGWVTQAISVIGREKHWTTYYKLLARGSIKTQALASRLLRLVMRVFPSDLLMLILDDTLLARWTHKAPGVAIRHEHSRKTNRPRFINAQCWVTLAAVVARGVVPIRSRLVPLTGNTNKLFIGEALVRAILPIAPNVRLLIDSWFMRARLVLPLLSRGVQIIGQVRRDTALFLPPEPGQKQRGRKRRYGNQLTPDGIATLPVTEHELRLYGKTMRVRLRSVIALARFLRGATIRAVWYEFFDDGKQAWSPPRLLLATETALLPARILYLYSLRWGIEPLFDILKRWWGVNNLWQQSRRVLELWMQIRSTAYALMHLLALALPDTFPLADIAPWRLSKPVITAGLFAAWMRQQFSRLPFRHGYDQKSEKFTFPQPSNTQLSQPPPA